MATSETYDIPCGSIRLSSWRAGSGLAAGLESRPGVADRLPRPLGILPPFEAGHFVFELFVAQKEMLDLAQHVGGQLGVGRDRVPPRLADGDGEDLFVPAFLVPHVEPADGTAYDIAAGEDRLARDDEDVEFIA